MKTRAVLAIVIAGAIAGVFFLRMGGGGRGTVKSPGLSASSPADPVPARTPALPSMAMAAVAASAPTPADFAKVRTLEEILVSKNDNDPRLDTEFNHLTPAQKKLMREKYQAMPLERRNERGTVVFVLGRNLASPEDVVFLEGVLSEPPCLSMSDCGREDKEMPGSTAHHDDGLNTTLYYPQLVALYSIERTIGEGSSALPAPMLQELRKALDASMRSPIPSVASKGEELAERLKQQG